MNWIIKFRTHAEWYFWHEHSMFVEANSREEAEAIAVARIKESFKAKYIIDSIRQKLDITKERKKIKFHCHLKWWLFLCLPAFHTKILSNGI